MTITQLPLPPARLQDCAADGDHDEQVIASRDALLSSLTAAIEAATDAAHRLDQLRSPGVGDEGIAAGRDGRDMAAHVDTAIRGLRAAWAVGHTVFVFVFDGSAL
jgi:hypothetical protein